MGITRKQLRLIFETASSFGPYGTSLKTSYLVVSSVFHNLAISILKTFPFLKAALQFTRVTLVGSPTSNECEISYPFWFQTTRVTLVSLFYNGFIPTDKARVNLLIVVGAFQTLPGWVRVESSPQPIF